METFKSQDNTKPCGPLLLQDTPGNCKPQIEVLMISPRIIYVIHETSSFNLKSSLETSLNILINENKQIKELKFVVYLGSIQKLFLLVQLIFHNIYYIIHYMHTSFPIIFHYIISYYIMCTHTHTHTYRYTHIFALLKNIHFQTSFSILFQIPFPILPNIFIWQYSHLIQYLLLLFVFPLRKTHYIFRDNWKS